MFILETPIRYTTLAQPPPSTTSRRKDIKNIASSVVSSLKNRNKKQKN